MKKYLYIIFVNNVVIKFLSHPTLSVIVPSVVGLYYGTLDIWGDDWAWIKDKQDLHELIFALLAGLTIFVLFVKGISEAIKSRISKKSEELMESLILFFNGLVKKKKDRFYNKAKHLKPNGDAFRLITQPIDQLEHVLDSTKLLLINGLKIESKNIGLTIIQGNADVVV